MSWSRLASEYVIPRFVSSPDRLYAVDVVAASASKRNELARGEDVVSVRDRVVDVEGRRQRSAESQTQS